MIARFFSSIVLLLANTLFLSAAELAGSEDYVKDNDIDAHFIAKGVFQIIHDAPWPANAMVVICSDSTAVICDSPNSEDATKNLLNEFLHYQTPGCSVKRIVAINTHFHNDCITGNAVYIDAGIPVYGSSDIKLLLNERGDAMRDLMKSTVPDSSWWWSYFDTMTFVPPDHEFELSDGKTFVFGTDSVIVYYPGPAHAPDNVVVWFPQRKVLYGGCMVRVSSNIGNLSDADVEFWETSINKLRPFDAEYIVPGHGMFGGQELIDSTIAAIQKYNNEVKP